MVATDALNGVYNIQENVWICGRQPLSRSAQCAVVNSTTGAALTNYAFPWMTVTNVVAPGQTGSVVVVGDQSTSSNSPASDVALCKVSSAEMSCSVLSFHETTFTTTSYVSFSKKVVLVGSYRASTTVTVVDAKSSVANSFVYTISSVNAILFSHMQSPLKYIGSFTAGTSVSATGAVNSIVAGVVRTDSGKLTLTRVVPASGSILNNAELVNAMVLENSNADSFIAGGLQLSGEDTGLHAYLLRVNVLFGAVLYGTRYRATSSIAGANVTSDGYRRVMSEVNAFSSLSRGVVRIDTTLYMIVDVIHNVNKSSVTAMHLDMQTGLILQQVHLVARNASLSCTSITSTGLFITVACLVTYNTSVVHSVLINTDLSLLFAKLPAGVMKQPSIVLAEETLPFQSFPLSTVGAKAQSVISFYNYSSIGGVQTFSPSLAPSPQPSTQPSSQPSCAPSSQPSSSPTSAPSVSPQPTSHPSSSGPTNTYKPTVKPTPRPSTVPSKEPTVLPTQSPSILPTAYPTLEPSGSPSVNPSIVSTTAPTCTFTRKPTTISISKPPPLRSRAPTQMPSSASGTITTQKGASLDLKRPELIVGYAVGALAFLWCLYLAQRCYKKRLVDVQKKLEVRELMIQARKELAEQPPHGFDLPGRMALYETVHGTQRVEAIRAKSSTALVDKSYGRYDRKTRALHTRKMPRNGAYLDSVLEDDTPMNTAPSNWYVDGAVVSGAYANSAPIQGMHIDQSAFFGFATGNVNPPNSVSSEDSGSLELSSVHSSEMDEVEYSVHLNERSVEALYRGHYLQTSGTRENLMEEGGIG